jgi:hypothetical protein
MSFFTHAGNFMAQSSKALTTAVGVALTVLTIAGQPALVQYMPPAVATGIAVAVAVLTPIATYLIPNRSGSSTKASS